MNDWLKQIWTDERRIAPSRAVMHPAWILAVVVLLVNDHVIKPMAFIEPVAGKLSDFAGLFLFPVLLATLLGVKTRRGLWLAGAATAVVFGAINTAAPLARAFDALVSTVVPFATTVDPTDLIALIAIPSGLWFFEPLMRSTSVRRTRRALEAAAVTVGGIASLATSPPPCNDCFDEPMQSSQISILNKTNELHILRMRALRQGIRIDCDRVRQNPGEYLVPAAFDAPQSWFVQSGQEIPVGQNDASEQVGCQVALIESDTVPDIFVFWDRGLPAKSFAFDADVPVELPADDQTVVLDADYSRTPASEMHQWRERGDCGGRADLCDDALLAPLAEIPSGARYFWRSQHETPLHFPRPTTVEGTLRDDDACSAPTAADGLAWEPPPGGELYVLGLDEGRDGCHELSLTADIEDDTLFPRGWWVCAPFDALQVLVPAEGERKRIAVTQQNRNPTFSGGGHEAIEISVFTSEGSAGTPALDRVYMTRGYSLPSAVDFEPQFLPIDGCAPTEVECGQVSLPADVELTAYSETVRPGESVSVGTVQPLDVFVVRAEARPVVDVTCLVADTLNAPNAPDTSTLGYIEAVVVRRSTGR